jgi:hypothetical protein
MFSWLKPSVQMLGRWQPWHDGHTEHDLGEEIHNISATEIRKQLREEGKLA